MWVQYMYRFALDASLNTSANVFVFGDFNDHHKNWLNYSGGTDRLDELCYNFVIISYDFIQMVNFPTWIPDCCYQQSCSFGYISIF